MQDWPTIAKRVNSVLNRAARKLAGLVGKLERQQEELVKMQDAAKKRAQEDKARTVRENGAKRTILSAVDSLEKLLVLVVVLGTAALVAYYSAQIGKYSASAAKEPESANSEAIRAAEVRLRGNFPPSSAA